jgi:ABC-type polysaccharide/polyol phosphate transport system ATPase subunit
MAAAVGVSDLSKTYRIYKARHQSLKEMLMRRSRGHWDEVPALRNVTFDIPAGQTVAVIGQNGSGKSTLLKLLAGILAPDAGTVTIGGRLCSLIELGAGFVAEYTGGENVFLYGALLGLSRVEITERFNDIVQFSELGSFIHSPVKNYSSGMYMRLGFAVAVHLDPEVLLLDEVLAVGDVDFQQKCYAHLDRLRAKGCTVILVSHDLEAVRRFGERAILLDHGVVVADGSPDLAIQTYFDRLAEGDSDGEDLTDGAPPDAVEVNREVRLLGVRYLDSTGTETRSPRFGEPLTIELRSRTDAPVGAVSVAITVFRTDGVRCFDARSAPEGIASLAAPGESRIAVDFPRCSLLAGAYNIDVALYDPRRRLMLDYHHRRYPFVVQGDAGGGGVVDMEHSWRIDRLEAGSGGGSGKRRATAARRYHRGRARSRG